MWEPAESCRPPRPVWLGANDRGEQQRRGFAAAQRIKMHRALPGKIVKRGIQGRRESGFRDSCASSHLLTSIRSTALPGIDAVGSIRLRLPALLLS